MTKNLPIEIIECYLSEEYKLCPKCGSELVQIGKKVVYVLW